jgi:prephenate dehydrogenase
VRDAELVVLAAPPLANVALLDTLAPAISAGDATLSDVSSVQAPMARRAAAHPGLRFVGGHPMSGRERSGYGAATADLFVDRPWVILPGDAAGESDVARVRTLAEACGARPVLLDPQTHDEAVAAVSHLPLLTSVALAETVTRSDAWPLARSLAAQGWRDTTRLARGDAALGAGILGANAPAVARWLRRYRERLDGWQDELDRVAAADAPDAAAAALGPRLAAVAGALGERT